MKKKVLVLASLVMAMAATTVKAQLNVGATTAPVAGAMLQVSGTGAGFLPPVMTTTNRDAIPTPPKGLIIFNSTLNQLQINTGTTAAPVWTAAGTLGDLRALGNASHISSDAGVGNNGTNPGTGQGNVGIGAGVFAAGPTANFNTGFNDGALASLTTGSANFAAGGTALNKNTTGSSNIAIGYQTMLNNVGGSGNVALGQSALNSNNSGANNVAIGQSSLTSNTTGLQNVGVGSGSLGGTTTGGYNVGLGFYALSGGLTNNDNVGVGTQAGSNLTTGSRNTAIGNYTNFADPTASYQLNISNAIFGTGLGGTVAAPSGNIGIGTAAPTSKLTVNGAATNLSAYNAAASTTIDFSLSNLAYTTANAGAFILNNLKDGGTYTLAVKGTTSGTSTFTAGGSFTVHPPVDNGATTAGKHTIYTFLVLGTDVYVSWVTGL